MRILKSSALIVSLPHARPSEWHEVFGGGQYGAPFFRYPLAGGKKL